MKHFHFLLLTLFVFSSSVLSGKHDSTDFSHHRFTCSRESNQSKIVYYFTKPESKSKNYPIVVICEGSSSKDDLGSVTFMHNFFKERVDALGCGILSIEKWGIDGKQVDEDQFWNHYTRSQRYVDHMMVISHLEKNKPEGWNGFLIFIGASEGGPLVNKLSIAYPKTLATINYSGAGDWSWDDELWEFFAHMRKQNWLFSWFYDLLPECLQFYGYFPSDRKDFDELMKKIKKNPSPEKWFGGMTYSYHADALSQKAIDCRKMYAPMLIVAGAQDSIIQSCDQFVARAQKTQAPVTYFRIENMDHWVRKRPDVIDRSFDWLKNQISS